MKNAIIALAALGAVKASALQRHCIYAFAACFSFFPVVAVAAPVARVGAVNWDCSVPSSTFFGKASTRALSPAKYRDRTPYYAEVVGSDSIDYRERTLEEYEQEMRYAIEAGIDYFAYCWYDRTPPTDSLPGASETCRECRESRNKRSDAHNPRRS